MSKYTKEEYDKDVDELREMTDDQEMIVRAGDIIVLMGFIAKMIATLESHFPEESRDQKIQELIHDGRCVVAKGVKMLPRQSQKRIVEIIQKRKGNR